jgi:hypothetical protein
MDGLTNVAPDAVAAKGQVLVDRPGRKQVIAPTGTWFLTTKDKHLGDRPEKHLVWIMDRVNQVIGELRKRVPDVKVDISLLVHDPQFRPGSLPRGLVNDITSVADLDIEAPEAGGDWVINKANAEGFFND